MKNERISRKKLFDIAQDAIYRLEYDEYEHETILDALNINESQYKYLMGLNRKKITIEYVGNIAGENVRYLLAHSNRNNYYILYRVAQKIKNIYKFPTEISYIDYDIAFTVQNRDEYARLKIIIEKELENEKE